MKVFPERTSPKPLPNITLCSDFPAISTRFVHIIHLWIYLNTIMLSNLPKF